ncbi:MAG: ATP-binding cassette domain-containing protein, partial [Gammaproteobacteria bacterium]
GEVHWCGEKIARCREQFHRQLNFSGHQYGLRGDLTALENLRYLIVDPVSDSALIESMARVGLGHCADLPARYLSQGQRRRLLLARLQATRSTCWILDEPLAALDHEGIVLVEKFCAEHLEAGGILIITSHQELSVSLRDSSELHLGGHNHA